MSRPSPASEEAARVMARAEEWIWDNPDAWEYMSRTARAEVAAGRSFSIRWLAYQVRKIDFVDSHGRPTVINNNLIAALARILADRYPEVSRFIEFRKATVDLLRY